MQTNRDPIKIRSLTGNTMKLDGGSMFGNAPKVLWQRWMTPDENNMIGFASRALCIKTPSGAILFETGIGAYLSPDMKDRFQVAPSHHALLDSLADMGLDHQDITHVVLSHLHFDHSGGLLAAWDENRDYPELLFPNAAYICGKEQFKRAKNPHVRDRASFIPELPGLLEKSGRLQLVSHGDSLAPGPVRIEFIESHGHTPGMMLSRIAVNSTLIYYAGDSAPGHAWVNLPITMGYDRFPEGLIDEKQDIFQRVCEEKAWLFYPHDDMFCASRISFDNEKGRFVPEGLVKKLSLDI